MQIFFLQRLSFSRMKAFGSFHRLLLMMEREIYLLLLNCQKVYSVSEFVPRPTLYQWSSRSSFL